MSFGPLQSSSPVLEPSRSLFGDVIVVLFLVAQFLDGMFTYLGIAAFGVSEGNPLIAHYIHRVGLGPSLAAAKLIAVACAIVLHLLGFHRVLALLTLVYLSLAIIPWAVVLFMLH